MRKRPNIHDASKSIVIFRWIVIWFENEFIENPSIFLVLSIRNLFKKKVLY